MSKRPQPHKDSSYTHFKKPRYSHSAPTTTTPPPPPGLTQKNASEVLQRYSGWLRNRPPDTVQHRIETVQVDGHDCYVATVILPKNSNVFPTHVQSERPFPDQMSAKRNAVFRAICELYNISEIDDNLMPTPKNPSKPGPPPSAFKDLTQPVAKNEPSSRSSRSPPPRPPERPKRTSEGAGNGDVESSFRTSSNKVPLSREHHHYGRSHEESRNMAREILGPKQSSANHEFLATSRFWARNPPIGTQAFCAVISITFTRRSDFDKLCRRLCILTSRPLPLGEVSLDIHDHHNKDLRHFPHVSVGPSVPVELSERQLDHTFEWTRKFVRSIANQKIDGLLEKAPYLFLPLRRGFAKTTCTTHDIAWEELNLWDSPVRELDLRNPDELKRSLEDAVLSPPAEFAHRQYAMRVRFDLTPYSPAPRKPDVIIAELATERTRSHTLPRLLYPDQPIVEAEHVQSAAKGGWVWTLNENRLLHHVIPELLALYFLPASVVRTGTLIPNIMSALDEHLIAAECNEDVFAGKLDHVHVQHAITTPAKRPLPHNYDRLETLGDAVLHFIASVDVCRRAEPEEEGEADAEHRLRTERHLIVSNRTLGASAVKAGIIKYVRTRVPKRRDYCPPGWIVEDDGALHDENIYSDSLGGKIAGDVVEALLGAAYLSGGMTLQPALDAIHTLHIPIHLRSVDELQTRQVLDRILGGRSRASEGRLAVLDYQFMDADKGKSVLSIPPRAINYEQYSLLGNAVLELLVTEQCWQHSHLTPQDMTKIKHGCVSMDALGALAVATDLVEQLSVSHEIQGRLNSYVAEMRASEGLARIQRQRRYWEPVSEFKPLGSAFQAVIGAIAEDCCFDLTTLRALYNAHIAPWVIKFGPPVPNMCPRTRLPEVMEAKGCRKWYTARAHSDAPGHRATDVFVHGQVVGHGTGSTVLEAITAASEVALDALADRLDSLCTCRAGRGE
ncbi:uncharacterized protein COLE_02972 [Cutaneotrichosporon oleaginosum]|uniref:uncharacterized protein n=1 Tax=Cutaneotrichosporon oleaginosum TaxID=879819 RepID=UPI00132206E5|nr:hypothetical protein COLE_02972 [Cutaneotrichosporon oleaginosum]